MWTFIVMQKTRICVVIVRSMLGYKCEVTMAIVCKIITNRAQKIQTLEGQKSKMPPREMNIRRNDTPAISAAGIKT